MKLTGARPLSVYLSRASSQSQEVYEMNITERYLTRVELAKALKISKACVDRWVKAGRLPKPLKLGPRSLFRVEEVVAAVEGAPARPEGGRGRPYIETDTGGLPELD